MVLEACIICVDNSDWTRNGDYSPTRWEAQVEASNFIVESKCDKNPENCIGIVSMAGKRVETPVTLTSDVSKLLKGFKEMKVSGDCDFITACNIAMLVLKHRQNKMQKQRILMFVASPIKHKPDDLVLLGKKLKKNNVAIDIISFGNLDTNREAVMLLINTANNSSNSNLMEVENDQHIVDCLFTSPILNDNLLDEGMQNQVNNPSNQTNPSVNQPPSNVPSGGLSQFERDINLAIQQSMEEEERRRRAAEGNQPQENKEVKNEEIISRNKDMLNEEGIDEEDIEAELEKARLLSIKEHEEILKREKEKEKNMKDNLINDDTFMKELLGDVGIEEGELKDVMNEVNKENEEGTSLITDNKGGKNEKEKNEKNEKNDDDENEKFIKK